MKHFSIAAAMLATVLTAGSAGATTVIFTSFQTSLNPGEALLTDFSAGFPTDAFGNVTLDTGSQGGFSAAPAASATTRTTAQYMNVGANQAETFIFTPTKEVSIYVGSLDSYNVVTFNNGETFNGTQIAALSGATANGDQNGLESNGRFTFNLDKAATAITLGSNQPAFEIADIAISAVPEPSAWVIMLGGMAMMGAALRAGRRRSSAMLVT